MVIKQAEAENEKEETLQQLVEIGHIAEEYLKATRRQVNYRLHGYECYFATAEEPDGSGDSTGVQEPYWVILKHELECRSIKRRDNTHVIIPVGLETVSEKYYYKYGDSETDRYVMQKTGGAHYHHKIGEYDLMADQFISKFISSGSTQIKGIVKIRELYEVGRTTGILPKPSILFEQFEIDQIYSYTTHDYNNNNNGDDENSSSSILFYKAFKPIETIKLHNGLMPSEETREFNHLLKEVKGMLQKLKNEDHQEATTIKTAAMKLLSEKSELEDEEYKKMLEGMR